MRRPLPALKTNRLRGSCQHCSRWFPVRKDGKIPRHSESADGGDCTGPCPGEQKAPERTRTPNPAALLGSTGPGAVVIRPDRRRE